MRGGSKPAGALAGVIAAVAVAITAGGLLFTGAMDAYLRAFDAKSGEELWQGRLPVPGVANPMTYLWKGEQYVAIGAGGRGGPNGGGARNEWPIWIFPSKPELGLSRNTPIYAYSTLSSVSLAGWRRNRNLTTG